MHPGRFDDLSRSLIGETSRRGALRGLAGVALGLAAAQPPAAAPGARRRRKARKTPKRNAFGCVGVGQPCQNAGQCCSGVCRGKKGKRRCRAHDTGGCRGGQREAFCGGTEDVRCATGGGGEGVCDTTTGNAGYCVGDGSCDACNKDADCREAFGPRAACVRCAGCPETGGTACVGPA